MTDTTPQASGIVNEVGTYEGTDKDKALCRVAREIEDHGVVEAYFDDNLGNSVKLRLGTTTVDYDTDSFIIDTHTDTYTFGIENLIDSHTPMNIT
jgi:hypothetical protein